MCTCSSLGRCSTVSEATAHSSRCFCEITSRLYRTPVKNSERSRARPLSKRFQWSNPTSLRTPLNRVALVRLVFSRMAASSISPMAILSADPGGFERGASARVSGGEHGPDHLTGGTASPFRNRPRRGDHARVDRTRFAFMLNPHIFRAYDVRGRIGADINPTVFRQVGRAYGTLIRRNGGRTVAVGRDNRESSAELKAAFIEGVLAAGIDIVDIGEVTTPMLYFATAHWRLDGGANITGRHNPVDYNGVKMVHPGSAPLSETEIQDLRQNIERGDLLSGQGTVTERQVRDDYFGVVAGLVRPARRLRVVVDAGNGVAGRYGPDLLRRIGCDVTELYCESDGRFPNHLPDPEDPENVVDLQAKVLELGADLGLAWDGDADRVGVIDERGRRHE